LITVGNHNHR